MQMLTILNVTFILGLTRERLGDITDLKGDTVHQGNLQTLPMVLGSRNTLFVVGVILALTVNMRDAPCNPPRSEGLLGWETAICILLCGYIIALLFNEDSLDPVRKLLKISLFAYPIAISILIILQNKP